MQAKPGVLDCQQKVDDGDRRILNPLSLMEGLVSTTKWKTASIVKKRSDKVAGLENIAKESR